MKLPTNSEEIKAGEKKVAQSAMDRIRELEAENARLNLKFSVLRSKYKVTRAKNIKLLSENETLLRDEAERNCCICNAAHCLIKDDVARLETALGEAEKALENHGPKDGASTTHHQACPCRRPEETLSAYEDCNCWEREALAAIRRVTKLEKS